MNDKCTACGEEYTTHLGLIGTCMRLQEAIAVVGKLESGLAEANDKIKYWQESQAYAEQQYLFQVAYNKTHEGTIKEYAAEVDSRKEYTDMMEEKLSRFRMALEQIAGSYRGVCIDQSAREFQLIAREALGQ
jgi:hypothetical protein